MAQYVVRSPAELQAACDAALAGDTILVHGGSYPARSRLYQRHGTLDHPIVFRAADEHWILCSHAPDPYWGGSLPANDSPGKPTDKDFAFLFIDDCSHVRIEGLKIQDCWPSIFFVKDTTHVTVRGCTLRHGTYAVFAKGQGTSHLLLEGNEWRQDDSADHRLWNKVDWKRAHGDEGADGLYRYFNGGFLSSKNIRGNVVIRHNRIMDAYNGIRLKAMGENDTPIPPAQWPARNADVHIVGNDFIRIRDNPIEPEGAAYNWHVRHNRIVDCHGWSAVGTKIVLDSLDRYLFQLATIDGLVNKRNRRAFAIVVDRMRVADSLARQLAALGMERRTPLVPSLNDYLAQKKGGQDGSAADGALPKNQVPSPGGGDDDHHDDDRGD